jgi:hypothetical protein
MNLRRDENIVCSSIEGVSEDDAQWALHAVIPIG